MEQTKGNLKRNDRQGATKRELPGARLRGRKRPVLISEHMGIADNKSEK